MPVKKPPAKVRIYVQVGVEEPKSVKDRASGRVGDVGPDGGDYIAVTLIAERLTQSMATHLATMLQREVVRRGFRPCDRFREVRG